MRWYLVLGFVFVLMFAVSALSAQPFTYVCGDEICDEGSEDAELIVSQGGRGDSFAKTQDDYPVILDPKRKKMFLAEQGDDGKLVKTAHRLGTVDPERLKLKKIAELDRERLLERPPEFRPERPLDDRQKVLRKKILRERGLLEENQLTGGAVAEEGSALKVLVVFMEFMDQKHSADFDSFDSYLQDLSDYFYEESNGDLLLDFYPVKNWYLAQEEMGYYGGDYESQADDLVKEAVNMIDLSGGYDDDGDGVLDGPLVLVHAGAADETVGGNTDLIWSFYSSTGGLKSNGMEVMDYILLSEEFVLGTAAHEFGHFFGLPDLYDTDPDDGESKGCGFFCLMGYGCYLDEISGLSPWSQSYLGWDGGLLEVDDSGTYEVGYDGSLKVPVDDNEYFLVENREESSFFGEKVGGVFIWHIDETVMEEQGSWVGCKGSRMDCNVVNANEVHKLVDFEEADNFGLDEDSDVSDYGGEDDVWEGDCGLGGCTSAVFYSGSSPSSVTYAGEDSGVSIEVLSSVGELMDVGVSFGGEEISYEEEVSVGVEAPEVSDTVSDDVVYEDYSDDSEVMQLAGSISDEDVDDDVAFEEEEEEVGGEIEVSTAAEESGSSWFIWALIGGIILVVVLIIGFLFLSKR